MTFIDQVADSLADQMAGNGVAGESVVREEIPEIIAIVCGGRGCRSDHIEVITPAGEFDAVIAHSFDQRGEFCDRKVGPLAGEEGDGAGHDEGKRIFWELKETKRNPWLAIPKG
jgi:hypothetical protein